MYGEPVSCETNRSVCEFPVCVRLTAVIDKTAHQALAVGHMSSQSPVLVVFVPPEHVEYDSANVHYDHFDEAQKKVLIVLLVFLDEVVDNVKSGRCFYANDRVVDVGLKTVLGIMIPQV